MWPTPVFSIIIRKPRQVAFSSLEICFNHLVVFNHTGRPRKKCFFQISFSDNGHPCALISIELCQVEISESSHKISLPQDPILYTLTDIHSRDIQNDVVGPLDDFIEIPIGIADPTFIACGGEVPDRGGSCIITAGNHIIGSIEEPSEASSIHVSSFQCW